MSCSSCGGRLSRSATFCPSCGTMQTGTSAHPATTVGGTIHEIPLRPRTIVEPTAPRRPKVRAILAGTTGAVLVLGTVTALAVPGATHSVVNLVTGGTWVLSQRADGTNIADHVNLQSGLVDQKVPIAGAPGLMTSSDGSTFFVDRTTGQVERLDHSAEDSILHVAATKEPNPATIALVQGKNEVWLVDTVHGTVQAERPTLTLAPDISDPPVRLAAGDVAVSDPNQPVPAAADGSGDLWVAVKSTGDVVPVSPGSPNGPVLTPKVLTSTHVATPGQPLSVLVIDGAAHAVRTVASGEEQVVPVAPGKVDSGGFTLPKGTQLPSETTWSVDSDGTRRLNGIVTINGGSDLLRLDPTGKHQPVTVPLPGVTDGAQPPVTGPSSSVVIADPTTGNVTVVRPDNTLDTRPVGKPKDPLQTQSTPGGIIVNDQMGNQAVTVDNSGGVHNVVKYPANTDPQPDPTTPPVVSANAPTNSPVNAPSANPGPGNVPASIAPSPHAPRGAPTQPGQGHGQQPRPTHTKPAATPSASPSAAAASGPPAAVAAPSPPTDLTAMASKSDASLSWGTATAPGGLASYDIQCVDPCASPVAAMQAGPADTTSTINNLMEDGPSYVFEIRSRDLLGQTSDWAMFPAVKPSSNVPAAPTVTQPSGSAIGDTTCAVSWTPGSDNGASISSWSVQATPSGGGSPVTEPADASATTATLNNLVNGTTYSITVTGQTADYTFSPQSEPVTCKPYGVPGSPTATSTAGDKTVTVSWQAPPSDGGSAITGYTISFNGQTSQVGSSTTTKTYSGLNNGTTYPATVVASNARGNGAASQQVNAKPAGTPIVSISATSSPNDSTIHVDFTVNWNGHNAGNCSLNVSGQANQAGGCSAIEKGTLSASTTYQFTVTAIADTATGSASGSARTQDAPPPPVTTPVTPAGSVTVSKGAATTTTGCTTASCHYVTVSYSGFTGTINITCYDNGAAFYGPYTSTNNPSNYCVDGQGGHTITASVNGVMSSNSYPA